MGSVGKEAAMGVLSRDSGTNPSRIVKTRCIPDTTNGIFHAEIKEAVETGSAIKLIRIKDTGA
ncbi:MAG: hypothetical protein ABSA58_22240 [Acetobacteraceae bacterium]|jgi:hypothetical protein